MRTHLPGLQCRDGRGFETASCVGDALHTCRRIYPAERGGGKQNQQICHGMVIEETGMIRGQVDGSSGSPFAPLEPGPADVHYNQQASSHKTVFDLSGPEVCTQQPHMLKESPPFPSSHMQTTEPPSFPVQLPLPPPFPGCSLALHLAYHKPTHHKKSRYGPCM